MEGFLNFSYRMVFLRPHSHPSSPHTQAEIEEKMKTAADRREKLDKLRVKNISEQLAKV